MKLCPKCNMEIDGSSQTCSACGADLSSEFEATQLSDDRSRERTELMPSAFATGHEGGFSPGTVLAGRYRLIMSIGKGGMGEVYKADDLELGQTVALKFLPATVANDEAALKRFRSEVRTARQVAHPNVCRVFDIAEANGIYFITMEFIEGDDLSMLLRRIGRLPSDKANEASRQLCFGLHAIHEAGILHRDLKPANIIIDSKGKARITDFGIAGVESDLTREDFRSGTPAYMSPEQLDGQGVTRKSDIYSLGLLLYEIFTGKQAVQFDSLPELLLKHQTTSPTNPSEILKDIDPMVESTILQCLEKDPAERPITALQVALMLPGGNPLEAAIAAGETPSPAMVAAAPKKGTLSLSAAGLCVAGILLFLTSSALMEYKYWVIPTGEKSGELLVERSRTIAASLGYPEKPADVAYGFAYDAGNLERIYSKDEALRNSRELMETGQPSPRMFRYRESPRPIIPWAGAQVTVQDPVMERPGEIRLLTDPVGRLLEFKAIPIQPQERSSETKPVKWQTLFEAAGLDMSKYEQVDPDFLPPVFADEKTKWKGPFISDPAMSVEIEAAAYNGRAVWFSVAMPWSLAATVSPQELLEPPMPIQVAAIVFATLIGFGIIVLSWYNFRSGRGDLRGSLRVILAFFIVSLLSGLFLADHVMNLLGEMWILVVVLRNSVFLAVLAGLMYSALEPQIRRLWPELLISWSRLVSGDLRDPMIGRDILMGALLGTLANVIGIFHQFVPHWIGLGPVPSLSHVFRWDGFFSGLADSLSWVPTALSATLSLTFILFILLFLTRRRWIAVAGFALLYSMGILGSPNQFSLLFDLMMGLVTSGILLIAVIRFGIVGLVAHQLFFVTLANRPFIFNPQSIYFEVSIAGALVMLMIVAYAFYVSLGGARLDLGRLLDPSPGS